MPTRVFLDRKKYPDFEVVKFLPKEGPPFTQVVDVKERRLLSIIEIDKLLEQLEPLPKIEQGLTRTVADYDPRFYPRLVWGSDNQRVYKCYEENFNINPSALKVITQPVDMLDIKDSYKYQLLSFTHNGYTYKIVCDGTTLLTWRQAKQLRDETIKSLQSGHTYQEDPNELTRTHAYIQPDTYEFMAREALNNPRNFYSEEYVTDFRGTSTMEIILSK